MAMGAQPMEIDFGSLRAFLGGRESGNSSSAGKPSSLGQCLQPPQQPSQAKRPERSHNTAASSVDLPSIRPEHDPFQDSANLNRKVAFKMLKQLGCPVQTVESDGDGGSVVQSFIEVRQRVQPVLFQMLIEFGYQPFVTVDQAVAIRVDQPRHRARDEVFASLAQRKPHQNLSEETPTSTRPKMSAEDEQRMVERLVERKSKKTVENDDQPEKEIRKYKSVAEQRAAVDRLTRARNEKDIELTSQVPAPLQTSASSSRFTVPRSETWPRPGAGVRGASADADYRSRPSGEDSRFSKSHPVRRSPCLSQVGTLMLQSAGSTNDTSCNDKRQALHDGGLASCARVLENPDGRESQSEDRTVEKSTTSGELHREVHQSEVRKESEPQSRVWIDNVLGPLQWPGKASSSRSKAEQQQHLQRLAKPRPPPLPQPAAEQVPTGAKRSPRAQKEACSRLAKPRDPPQVIPNNAACATEGDTDTPGTDGRRSRQSEASEESEGAEEPQVVIIPSMLSQFSQGLERIDEDAPPPSVSSKSGCRETRQKQRARSVPPPSSSAKPYSIPVVPESKNYNTEKNRNCSNARGRRDSRRKNSSELSGACSEIPESSIEQLLNDPDLIAEVVQDEIDENGVEGGEAMLAQIDRLYTSLLQRRESSTLTSGRERDLPHASSLNSHDLASARNETVRAEIAPRIPSMLARPSVEKEKIHGACDDSAVHQVRQQQPSNEDYEDDGTSLLTNIDQLYNEIIHSDSSTIDQGQKISPTPYAEEELPDAVLTQKIGHCANNEEVRDLVSMLEEVLWSALLLKRNAESTEVQASLLELVTPPDLAQCYALCGTHGFSPSLLQRLSAELPAVHTGLLCNSPQLGGGGSKSISSLASCLRQARDHLLILASTASTSASRVSEAVLQPSNGTAAVRERASKKTKARKSSLSHWTSDSLSALEAPPRRLTQRGAP